MLIQTNTANPAQASRPRAAARADGASGPTDSYSPSMGNALAALSQERKLVAPSKSSRGDQMLSLVDAQTAESLLEAGRDVYAVAGQSKDTQHNRTVQAENSTLTTSRVVSEAFVRRTYNYELKSLLDKDALSALPQGEGLPLGLNGVFLDANSCSRVISADSQDGRVNIRPNASSVDFQQRGFTGDESVSLQGRRIQGGIVRATNVRDPIMMLGACIGITSAMAMGAPQIGILAGLIGGGIVGREIGSIAQRHMPARQYLAY